MRIVLILALVASLASSASASAMRIDLNKANQATAPVQYKVEITEHHGMLSIRFELPRSQKVLDHLWRVDVVLRKGKGTALSAPLGLDVDAGVLNATFIVDKAALRSTEIWIRVGEHAPMSETIYAVDLKSFRP